MRAVVLHQFGGPLELELAHVALSVLGPDDVLVWLAPLARRRAAR